MKLDVTMFGKSAGNETLEFFTTQIRALDNILIDLEQELEVIVIVTHKDEGKTKITRK